MKSGVLFNDVRECVISLGIGGLLPPDWSPYGSLIEDALALFIARFSEQRSTELLAEQRSLRSSSSSAARLVALLHRCPTLHKLGQVVARDRRLPPELRRKLVLLESMTPITPIADIEEVLQREWSADQRARVELASRPLAEASVAVVTRFAFSDGSSEDRGVAKVLRAGIEDRLAEEIAALSELGAFLDDRRNESGLASFDFRDTLDRVAELLASEIRLDIEQAHLAEATRVYRGAVDVVVPRLLPMCTDRVTAMTFIEGPTIAEVARADGERASRAARIIVDALIAQPLFSRESDAIVHGDPHAGNLLLTPEGRLGLIDWSLAGRLNRQAREDTVQLIVGGSTLDAGHIGRTIERLSGSTIDEGSLRRVIEESLAEVRREGLPGIQWITRLLDRAALRARARFHHDLLLFRKSLLTLEGVVADLDERCSIDAILFAEAGARLLREWPIRWIAPPTSRAFSTHLSTADLAALWWSASSAWTRVWFNPSVRNP